MKQPTPACPASTILDGPPTKGPSSLCGVLVRDRAEDDDPIVEGNDWHVFTAADDATTVGRFCCDRYTECLIWRDEKGRIDAQRRGLHHGEVSEPETDFQKILNNYRS